MPMIDLYAPAGTFRDRAKLARDLATAVMTIERVPNIPLFRQNTAAFVHELPLDSLSNVDGDSACVRVQVLTNAGGLDREKQLAVVAELTRIVGAAAGDPAVKERIWVLLTEAPDGGWGLAGHAHTNAELVAAARVQLGERYVAARIGTEPGLLAAVDRFPAFCQGHMGHVGDASHQREVGPQTPRSRRGWRRRIEVDGIEHDSPAGWVGRFRESQRQPPAEAVLDLSPEQRLDISQPDVAPDRQIVGETARREVPSRPVDEELVAELVVHVEQRPVHELVVPPPREGAETEIPVHELLHGLRGGAGPHASCIDLQRRQPAIVVGGPGHGGAEHPGPRRVIRLRRRDADVLGSDNDLRDSHCPARDRPPAAAVAEPRHASDPLRRSGAPDVVQTRGPLNAPPRRERIVLPEQDVVVEVEADDGEVAEIDARALRSEENRRQEKKHSFLEQPLGEHDLHDSRHRLRASPVALQLGRERDPTDGLAAGLHDTLEAGAMRLERGTADCIDDGIHLVTLT